MKRRVLVTSRSFARLVQTGKELLEGAGFELHHVAHQDSPLTAEKLARIVRDIKPDAIVAGVEPITWEVLAASDRLRMIMKHGVGIDNIDLDAATSLNIVVANAPGTNTDAVADLAISMMLALLRDVCNANNTTKEGKWERYIGRELGALVVGVIGTGRIGAQVIKRVHGFGARILAYDVQRNDRLVKEYGVEYVPLDQLLVNSDIVTLHIPLTDRTRQMIDDRTLSKMKEAAYLINCARGELIDERALYNHLKSGHIAGAALDVFVDETPRDKLLLKLDNVLATPHIAAYTYEAIQKMDRICAKTIIDTFQGKIAENVLNPDVVGQIDWEH